MNWVWLILLGLGSYALGSLSPSVLMSRVVGGFDIRKKGSGNAGTTNMLRVMGWKMGIITFVVDFLKGALPTLLGLWIGPKIGFPYAAAYVAGGCVLLGHAFPAYAHFKGGKCVASGAGVFLVLNPLATAIVIVIAIIIMIITRRVSVGSVLAFLIYPIVLFFLDVPDPALPWFGVGVGILVLFLHRENIKRLFLGQEKELVVAKKRSWRRKKK